MTRLTGRALCPTVYIGEDDTRHHRPRLSEDLPVAVVVVGRDAESNRAESNKTDVKGKKSL
jgi:hypothetical protein